MSCACRDSATHADSCNRSVASERDSVGEEQRLCSGQLFLWLIVAISCISGLLFGYDTGVISGASVLLQTQFELSSVQLEVVVSSAILSAAASSLYSGSLNSRFGRRPTIVFASVVFVVGAAAMGSAYSYETLIIGRVIVGVAVGLSSGTVPLFIAELAPTALRGKLIALNNVCIVSGQLLAAIIDGSFATHPDGWRWMLGLGGVPALIQLAGLVFLPESPRWLLEKGQVEQARAVMKRARPRTLMSDTDIDADIEEMRSCIEAEKAAGDALKSAATEGVPTRQAGAAVVRVAAWSLEANATAAHAAGAGGTVTAFTMSELDEKAATCWKRTMGLPAVRPSDGDFQARTLRDVEGGTPHAAAGDVARPGDEGGSISSASRGDAADGEAVAADGGTARGTEAPQPFKLWRANTPAHRLLHLLYPVRRQLRLGVGVMMLQQLVGINTIMYYSTPILKQAFYSDDPDVSVEERAFVIWLSAPVAFGQLIGCLTGMHLIDRQGRRPLVLRSIFLCAVTLFFMGANFYLDERLCSGSLAGGTDGRRRAQAGTSYMYDAAAGVGAGTGAGARLGSYKYGSDPVQAEGLGAGAAAGLGVEENPICALTGWLSLVGMFFYLVSFGLGMSPIPWALNAELYPLGVRSICVGIATAANWITNFVVAATFLSLLEVLGPARTFWLYGSFAAAGFVWLSFAMPETAGKSLEEIEEIFR